MMILSLNPTPIEFWYSTQGHSPLDVDLEDKNYPLINLCYTSTSYYVM